MLPNRVKHDLPSDSPINTQSTLCSTAHIYHEMAVLESDSSHYPSKKPGLLLRLQIWLSNLIPIDSWLPLGLLTLLLRRNVLQNLNLLPAPDAPTSGSSIPNVPYRSPDGSGYDVENFKAGASETPFARNMTPNPVRNPLRDPPVQLVAQKLLARQSFKPAGDQLNVLAAAWIQFMTHDWMRGVQSETKRVTLDKGVSGCPLHKFSFQSTLVSDKGTVRNERTHVWDTSVVYGSDRDSLAKVRQFKKGFLVVDDEQRGVLPRYSDGTLRVGDNMNSWAGVMLLQDLFIREHNAVCEAIAAENPHLANNDEALFNLARLVVTAVAAKVHTVDWTVELLKMEVLDVGMKSNWYGLLRGLNLPIFNNANPPGLFSLVGKKSENHGIPFSLTEEFVAVYRMHPLLPDGLPLESGYKSLEELVGVNAENHLATTRNALETWDAMIKYPCGNLQLFNYPRALRNLTPTESDGKPKPPSDRIDLAALDLYRDRERGIRNFNDFRRALHMRAYKNYDELTGGDEYASRMLSEVYGPNGIEDVDLLVGNLAEKKIRGFALSETQFMIFLVMASRRLESDRFLNENFNEKSYTKTGLNWVHNTNNFRDLFDRHFPELNRHFESDTHSAFKPTATWPQIYLGNQEYSEVTEVEVAEPLT